MVNGLHCDTCDRDFVNYHAAYQHRDAVGHWECEVCYKLFNREDDADKHMAATNHVQSRYCHDCRRGFMSVNNYQQHRNSHFHREAQISCPFCKSTFVTASGVAHHLETGSCSRASGLDRNTIFAELRRRDPSGVITNKLLEWHGDPVYSATKRTWNGQYFECYLCHNEFGSLKSLDQHLNSPRHASKLYHCPKVQCGKQFVTLAALFNHLESESCGHCRFEQVQRNVGNFLSGNRMLTFN